MSFNPSYLKTNHCFEYIFDQTSFRGRFPCIENYSKSKTWFLFSTEIRQNISPSWSSNLFCLSSSTERTTVKRISISPRETSGLIMWGEDPGDLLASLLFYYWKSIAFTQNTTTFISCAFILQEPLKYLNHFVDLGRQIFFPRHFWEDKLENHLVRSFSPLHGYTGLRGMTFEFSFVIWYPVNCNNFAVNGLVYTHIRYCDVFCLQTCKQR